MLLDIQLIIFFSFNGEPREMMDMPLPLYPFSSERIRTSGARASVRAAVLNSLARKSSRKRPCHLPHRRRRHATAAVEAPVDGYATTAGLASHDGSSARFL